MKNGQDRLPSTFGFRVHSAVPFKFQRAGGGNGTLEVALESDMRPPAADRLLSEWNLRGAANVSAKLYLEDGIYRYWISDAGWYRIDPINSTVRIPQEGDEVIREHRLWGVPTLLCATYREDFFLHAAAAEVENGAVLLAAPGRHGKTTLAMAFHREGYRVVSEDSACLRLSPEPALLPGPALLRIRPDVFDGRAPAGTHVVSIHDDRIYLALDEKRRGSVDPVPIRALVFLRESADDIYLEQVPPARALPDLWALGFRLPNDGARAQCFKQITRFAGNVPVWNLYRPLRLDRLPETVSRIVNTVGSSCSCA
jgi:hypothetical protein